MRGRYAIITKMMRCSSIAWLLTVAACSKSAGAEHDEPKPNGAASLQLEVHLDGTTTTWQQEVFDRTPLAATAGKNNDGDARDTWSLRDLVHSTYGSSAHVVEVVGDSRLAIAPSDWSDPSRTPIVHKTRRGHLNFCWADASGHWGETLVKNVNAVELQH
jgi:hypothetical protein